MKRQGVFPFTAIIGQEEMKKALILNVVNPRLGGVLIQGEKGTAKSTAVRALADLLPPRKCIQGCHFMMILRIKQTGVTTVTNCMTPKNLQ